MRRTGTGIDEITFPTRDGTLFDRSTPQGRSGLEFDKTRWRQMSDSLQPQPCAAEVGEDAARTAQPCELVLKVAGHLVRVRLGDPKTLRSSDKRPRSAVEACDCGSTESANGKAILSHTFSFLVFLAERKAASPRSSLPFAVRCLAV